MRTLSFVIILFLFSCKSLNKSEKIHRTLTGNWLILYPDHKLNNSDQRAAYGKIQDSVVGLKGLKLITFSDNGVFQQIDDPYTKGKWGLTPDNVAFIQDGGKGFENFSAKFTDYEKGELQLTELMNEENEKITLVWHLKKLDGNKDAVLLLGEESNAWRRPAKRNETPENIKARLSSMLRYFAAYYNVVNKEASYFIPSRVILPLKFYQHSIGLQQFGKKPAFAELFYDMEQAQEAHQYLKRTMDRLHGRYPSLGSNYIDEYVAFMNMMADEVTKLD